MKRILLILFITALIALPLLARTVGTDSTNIDSILADTAEIQVDSAAMDTAAEWGNLNSEVLGLLSGGNGSFFYVDSGTDQTTGVNWANAVGTLDEAINLCTNDAGDIILIAPGHAETLDGADGFDADKTGIKIIGLGVGENRPVFTYDTATDEGVIGGDDVEIHNCIFLAHVTDVAHAIDVETGAENFVIEGCDFVMDTEATDEFTDAIEIAANCDNGRIENCRFYMGGGGADTAISYVGADYLRIIDNEIYGDYAVGCIESLTTVSVQVTIKDNVLYNGDISIGLNTEPCLELKSDDTGVVANNVLVCNVANPELAVVGADMHVLNNAYNETEGSVLEVGKTYVRSMTSLAIDDDLFDVSGGSILITSFTGVVTTVMQAQANALEIVLDADDTYDYDFTTAVETNGDAAGTRYVFDNTATESVLTPCEGADGGAAGTMLHWLCAEGMIELNAAQAAQTGGVKWFMTFIPLEEGITVTAQ